MAGVWSEAQYRGAVGERAGPDPFGIWGGVAAAGVKRTVTPAALEQSQVKAAEVAKKSRTDAIPHGMPATWTSPRFLRQSHDAWIESRNRDLVVWKR